MKIAAFLLIALVTIGSAGCGSAIASTENITSVKFSVSASVNWDADQSADGVQFTIRPLGADGFLIKDTCVVNAKVWKCEEENTDNITLIQEWRDIIITRKDYDRFGALVRLEFSDYVPKPWDNGILWAEAIVPGGATFSFQEPNVLLGYCTIQNLTGGATCVPGTSGCCPVN